MIIALEGSNGVGKTTYARKLSAETGWPIFRALRGHGDKHNQAMLDEYRRLGIPANTFVDDIYQADMFRMLKPNVILDRSMLSALAYDAVYQQDTMMDPKAVWNVWCRLAMEAIICLVWLHAPSGVARERCSGERPSMTEDTLLTSRFALLHRDYPGPKMAIDTSEVSVADGVAAILELWRRQ
jgi:thymidylate kinase